MLKKVLIHMRTSARVVTLFIIAIILIIGVVFLYINLHIV